MTTKDFELGAVLSLSTGMLFCKSFGDVHELAEHLAGEPIFTHQFASAEMFNKLQNALFEQYPWLAEETGPVLDDVPQDEREQACRAYVSAVAERRGVTHLSVRTVDIHTPFYARLEHLGKGR